MVDSRTIERSPLLRGTETSSLDELASNADIETVDQALEFAALLVEARAFPGNGDTLGLWSALATLAARDLEIARAVEPHLDAAAILHEAGAEGRSLSALGRTWGVFAAEGAEPRLTGQQHGGRWTLSGVKPWCSLAGVLDAALVTAWVGDARALFAVNLRHSGVAVNSGEWHARGLVNIPSGPVAFDAVDAVPVGDRGWYLARPGFQWGGIGVAACWYGGALGIARSVMHQARSRPASSMIDTHLGAMDEALTAARLALGDAAASIDAGQVEMPALLSARARGIVARTCEEVLWRAGHAMGPGPLATDAPYAQRVADLHLYVRQHHAERDQESLGTQLRSGDALPW